MAGLSDIEWTDATWNPVSGCTIISPGCTNCYAMRMAARLQAMGHASYRETTRKSGNRSVWTGKIHLNDRVLEAPLTWRQPKLIFVNSMSDLFQDSVPAEYVERVWNVMSQAHWHIFQILTKRPDNMERIVRELELPVLENVWLGTSVESRAYTPRIDNLRKTKAAVRFISFEPLIASVGQTDLSDIDWAIVGGESGPGARPMDVAWVDEIKQSCDEYETAFFFKQWGGVNKKKAGRLYREQTWDELPAQLRIVA
jgi:protein gp37